jgi:hypothetical protein
LQEEVLLVLRQLRELRNRASLRGRGETIAGLRGSLRVEELRRKAIERSFLTLQKQFSELEGEVKYLTAAREATATETHKRIRQLEDELAEARHDSALLASKLRKVVPLRGQT